MTIFAAIQVTSTDDYQGNVDKAVSFIEKAIKSGAKVVALPETFTYIGDAKKLVAKYKQELTGSLSTMLANIARGNGIYLLAGSVHETIAGSDKMYNTSILFGPDGSQANLYRKIHLFDANLPGPEKYKESDTYESGDTDQLTVTETPYGRFGQTVCYDLRFPELYRKLMLLGAQVIFVPSAFTAHTGQAHWEVLLRARAIENQVYIVAPNQFGYHSETKESYGNTMIIDPWGQVISRASAREEVIYADLDLEYQAVLRKKLPCLDNMKLV